MKVVGVDPGKKGALALMIGGELKEMVVMPEDSAMVRDLLLDWCPDFVYLEKAQAMPGNGGVSMFNYAKGFGEIIGILKALRIPHTQISPGAWCKVMHKGQSRKDTAKKRSMTVAFQTFPDQTFIASARSKVPHDGLMDAALIAEYGRREEYNKGNH